MPAESPRRSGCFGPLGLSEGLDLQGINSFCRVVGKRTVLHFLKMIVAHAARGERFPSTLRQ